MDQGIMLETKLIETCREYPPLTIIRAVAGVMASRCKGSTYGRYKKYQQLLENVYFKMIAVQ